MLEAGVIVPIAADKVKCVSPTTLAQKVHQGGGLTRDELLHRVNDQCVAAGLRGHSVQISDSDINNIVTLYRLRRASGRPADVTWYMCYTGRPNDS